MRKICSVKQSSVFSRAYRSGQSVAEEHIVVYALKRRKKGESMPSCLGLTVSKKFGRAVDRSRARRILREAYRPFLNALPCGYDIIVVARYALRGSKMNDAYVDMASAFTKLGLIKGEAV